MAFAATLLIKLVQHARHFKCSWLYLQMVNFNKASQTVEVEVKHLVGTPESMTVTTLNSTDGTVENSFEEPLLVSDKSLAVNQAASPSVHALLYLSGTRHKSGCSYVMVHSAAMLCCAAPCCMMSQGVVLRYAMLCCAAVRCKNTV